MIMTNPRLFARSLFDRAIEAAEPAQAVRRSLREAPLPSLPDGRLIVLAVGKAACAMMEEALKHVPKSVTPQAIAVTNYENARPIKGCEVIAAGHPVPDKNGLKAARQIADALVNTGPSDFVLTLISGGGSALLPSPTAGITLEDKIKTNELLLRNGYDIKEINLIRQQLSDLKGGGLTRLASPSAVRSLIISDVIGDDLRVIASGPTVTRIGTAAQAAELLRTRGHLKMLPKDVRTHLLDDNTQPSDVHAQVQNQLICSNRFSLDAMLDAADVWAPIVVADDLQGDVTNAAVEIAKFIQSQKASGPRVFLWGGETTVNVTGTGRGGRNQEMALRVALLLKNTPGNWVFLSGGTDGRDGPTDAAGGLIDAKTIERIETAGGDIEQLLTNCDSYHALSMANDLLVTGSTGTNVADVQVFVSDSLD